MKIKKITGPLEKKDISRLECGDWVLYSGTIYTARDAAHERIAAKNKVPGEKPYDLKNKIVFYAGPTPAKPGQVTGSIGPTTSERMDSYTPALLKAGLRAMIGKGQRSLQVKAAIKKYGSVYFAAIGGVAALNAKTIKNSEVVAYGDLGTEAIRKVEVEGLLLVVACDSKGRDIYEEGRNKFKVNGDLDNVQRNV